MSIPTTLFVLDGDDWKTAFDPQGNVFYDDHGNNYVIDAWRAVGIDVQVKWVDDLEKYQWEFVNTICQANPSLETLLEFWNRK